MKTQTSRKTNAPATTPASAIPAPQTHDEAPAPDIAAQIDAAAQGHSFGALGVSAAPAGAIQPKLTVGAADDQYEAEADRIAGQVMRMPDPTVQRAEVPEEDELIQTKPAIQRAADGSFDAGAEVTSRIGARRGSGSPLPESTRQFMEPRFGADFSGVRVHADSEADRLSQDLSARAFTTGSDIYFRQGEFSPSSSGGQELLAHELTHVVQQGWRAEALQRQEPSRLPGDANKAIQALHDETSEPSTEEVHGHECSCEACAGGSGTAQKPSASQVTSPQHVQRMMKFKPAKNKDKDESAEFSSDDEEEEESEEEIEDSEDENEPPLKKLKKGEYNDEELAFIFADSSQESQDDDNDGDYNEFVDGLILPDDETYGQQKETFPYTRPGWNGATKAFLFKTFKNKPCPLCNKNLVKGATYTTKKGKRKIDTLEIDHYTPDWIARINKIKDYYNINPTSSDKIRQTVTDAYNDYDNSKPFGGLLRVVHTSCNRSRPKSRG